MTRTHVDEAELIQLQRDALRVYQRLAAISRQDSELTSLALTVSVHVDGLTEFVRHSRYVE